MTRDELIERVAKAVRDMGAEIDAPTWEEMRPGIQDGWRGTAREYLDVIADIQHESPEARDAVCREIGVGAALEERARLFGKGSPYGEWEHSGGGPHVHDGVVMRFRARLTSARPDPSEAAGTGEG